WKNILDNHIFWQDINEKLDFEKPKSKGKYTTYYSIFNKNWKKLCSCKKELKRNKQKSI
ncbi:7867_t:CDS:1, partial [Racocetra persica]